VEFKNPVIMVTPGTLEHIMAQYSAVFLLFYAPWDEKSVLVASTLQTAAETLEARSAELGVFAAIDCTKNSAECKAYGVKALPVLHHFERGGPSRLYEGPRLVGDLVQVVCSRLFDNHVNHTFFFLLVSS
jgi:hypothetical protein